MRTLTLLAASGFALLESLAAGFTLPMPETQLRYAKRSINAQTQQELASTLSSDATIVGPSDPYWATETERYMLNIQPQVSFAVRPGCEDDVSKIVSNR